MSGKSGESPNGSDEGGELEFESWLRKAAGGPPDELRIRLPQPGQVIAGKYRIEEQLGKGGMGAVYRATHVVSDKAVALKWMLRPATDERAKQRFTREARAAGRIDHPNVVDVYDIGQDGDAGYLVMELLHGESLRSRLAHGPLGVTAVVDLLLPAMRGVAAAHREGVIHRDLKPDNIFLCKDPHGVEREAKVLDFGISAISAPDYDSQTTLTKDGTVLGTPTYMSPEQLESVREADARTDVYAFGVILYEALTGCVPFVGSNYSALVLAIANTKPRAPRELRPEIPVGLERVVLWAMDKDRSKRLESMDALVAALVPFASAQSAGSGEHPSREMQRVTLPRARTRRGRLVATLALGVLAALAWWLTRTVGPTPAPSVSVPPRPEASLTPAAKSGREDVPAMQPPEGAAEPAASREVGTDFVPTGPAQPGAAASVLATDRGAPPAAAIPPKRSAQKAAGKRAGPASVTAVPTAAPAAGSSTKQARAGSINQDEL